MYGNIPYKMFYGNIDGSRRGVSRFRPFAEKADAKITL